MNPPEEFRKHAEECRWMAKSSRDEGDKATWNRMAERWLLCAKLAENQLSVAHLEAKENSKRHRRPAHRWAA
jgi:hypothetical protein